MEIGGIIVTKKQTTIITILSIIAFLLALTVTGRIWFRLDLTKNRAYTISKVSRNIYKELPDPVSITYYLSNKLRTVLPAPGEVEDTLREFAAHSRGKVRLVVRDPINAGLQSVEAFGLQPRQVPVFEQDETGYITVYSGIVIEYLDKMDVLPWVISTETLEYDLTSRIRAMVNEKERWIGVIVGDSYRQWKDDFSYLNSVLSGAGYRARTFFPGEEIPDNTPALFVFGGVEELDDWALYRIDRYIQLGGKVLFAAKGVFVDTFQGSLEPRLQRDLGLLDMIASYGIIIRPELALDRNALRLQFQTRLQSGATQYRIVRYPLWISVQGENGNSRHPVSSGFSGLDLYWASPLELAASASIDALSLFTSSKEGWTMREELNTNPETPFKLEREAEETRGEKILGASLSGVFTSFFKGASKPVREGSTEELPDMPEYARPSRIIVIGETDFATNMLGITEAVHNLDFLLRAADWLANDDDVIGIRSRQPQTKRFDKISDPADRAAVMRFVKIFNTFVVPLSVLAAGFVVAYRRKKRAQSAAQLPAKENSDDV